MANNVQQNEILQAFLAAVRRESHVLIALPRITLATTFQPAAMGHPNPGDYLLKLFSMKEVYPAVHYGLRPKHHSANQMP